MIFSHTGGKDPVPLMDIFLGWGELAPHEIALAKSLICSAFQRPHCSEATASRIPEPWSKHFSFFELAACGGSRARECACGPEREDFGQKLKIRD